MSTRLNVCMCKWEAFLITILIRQCPILPTFYDCYYRGSFNVHNMCKGAQSLSPLSEKFRHLIHYLRMLGSFFPGHFTPHFNRPLIPFTFCSHFTFFIVFKKLHNVQAMNRTWAASVRANYLIIMFILILLLLKQQ